jgi:phosphotransacetylase
VEDYKPILNDCNENLVNTFLRLSRGCKAEDIVDAAAITAVQSQARKA